MPTKLESFVAHARTKGMDHQTIRMLLLSSGWKERDIVNALASQSLDVPVPVPQDAGSARDAFFHLLTFTTLYSTVISLIVLAFDYISRWFPDAAMAEYYYNSASDLSAIRWSLAVIIVSAPLFFFLSRTLHREVRHHPEKLASGVRRWLTYLTLFITACTITGDLITLLFFLLDGELSVRFLLKVLAVLVLSGVPFTYYFLVLRMEAEEYASSRIHALFRWVSILLIGLFVFYGIWLAGSPNYGRQQRFDAQRVEDLRVIQNEIMNEVYGDNRYDVSPASVLPKPLPKTLDEVAKNATYQKLTINDPETGEPYTYTVKGNSYDLCATFALSRDQTYDIVWNHPAGNHCFTFDALDRASK